MIKFTCEITGLDALIQKLRQEILEQIPALLKARAPLLRSLIREQFATSGAAGGEPWPPRKRPAPWPLLVKSGRLRDSLTKTSHPEHIEILLNNSTLLFGTLTPYATYLHHGTNRLPERPLLTDDLAAQAGLEIIDSAQPLIPRGDTIIPGATFPLSSGL